MSNFDKGKIGKCEYLIEHEGEDLFDEIAFCPRMLNEREKRLLLDDLAERIIDYGENLVLFLLDNPDVDMESYYDRYYRRLSSLIGASEGSLRIRYIEPELM